ncbi:nucleoside 2-deoxyribosyltransferase [Desulfobacula sp.]|uniref:nucleoside 2-deoxyribosyltransferase n=1 Tax=Desulfobacula sp. TaxID=2593537 RepID=UPI001EB636D3|nr:nucleoside 2-deoxyribosyltransferase [Desulfobacula sp.]
MDFIGIVGARKYRDKESVVDFIRGLPADSVIVTSTCKGVCRWVVSAAKERGLAVKVFTPDLSNVQAKFEVAQRYYERNRQLIDACDVVCAFVSEQAGFTGGTKFEVEYALKLGKPVQLLWESSISSNGAGKVALQIDKPERFSNDWMSFFQKTFA